MATINEVEEMRTWSDRQFALAGFDAAEMLEIRTGFNAGLTNEEVALYADQKFDFKQMYQILRGFESGLTYEQVAGYADPIVGWKQMDQMRWSLENEQVLDRVNTKNVVLELFDVEGQELPDALLFREGAPSPYVVAHSYDMKNDDWGFGDYFSDLGKAYDRANPEIIESASVRWTREDVAFALEKRDVEPSRENVDLFIAETNGMENWVEGATVDGNEFLDNEAWWLMRADVFKDGHGINKMAKRADDAVNEQSESDTPDKGVER